MPGRSLLNARQNNDQREENHQEVFYALSDSQAPPMTAAAPLTRRRETFSASGTIGSGESGIFHHVHRKRRAMLSSAPSSQQSQQHFVQQQNGNLITANGLIANPVDAKSDPNLVKKRIEKKRELETIYNVEANIKRKLVPPSMHGTRRKRANSSHRTSRPTTSGPSAGALPRLGSSGASQKSSSTTRSHSASAARRHRSSSRQKERSRSDENLVLHPGENEAYNDNDNGPLDGRRSRRASPSPPKRQSEYQSPLNGSGQTPTGGDFLSPAQVMTLGSESRASISSINGRRRSAFSALSNKSSKVSPMQQKNVMTQKKNQLDFLEKNLDLKKRQERELELAIRLQKRQLQLLRRKMKIHQDKEEKAKAAMERFEAMGGPENVFKKLEEANRLLESKEKRLKSLAADLTEVQRMTEDKQHHLTKLETNLKADIQQIQDRLEKLKDMEQDFKKKQRDTNLRELKLKSLEEQLDYKHRLNEEKRREILTLEEQLKRSNKLNSDKKNKLRQMEHDLLFEKEQLETRQKRLVQDTDEFQQEQRQNEVRQREQWEQVRQMEEELTTREKTIVSILDIDDKDIATYGSSPKAIEHKLRALKDSATKADQFFTKRSGSAKHRSETDQANIDISTLDEDDDTFTEDKESVQRSLFTPRGEFNIANRPPVDLKTQAVQTEMVQIMSALESNTTKESVIKERMSECPQKDEESTKFAPMSQHELFQRETELVNTMSTLHENLQHSELAHRAEIEELKKRIQSSAKANKSAAVTKRLEKESEVWNELSMVRKQIAEAQGKHLTQIDYFKEIVANGDQITKGSMSDALQRERALSHQITQLFEKSDILQGEHDNHVSTLRQVAEKVSSSKKEAGNATQKTSSQTSEPVQVSSKEIHDSLRFAREQYESNLRNKLQELQASSAQESAQPASQWEQQVKELKQELLTTRKEHEQEIERLREKLQNAAEFTESPSAQADDLRLTVKMLQRELVEARESSTNPLMTQSTQTEHSDQNTTISNLRNQPEEQRQNSESLVSQMQLSLNNERDEFEKELENLQEETRQLKIEYHHKLSESEDQARNALRKRVQQEREKLLQRERERESRHRNDIAERSSEIESLKKKVSSLRDEFVKEKNALLDEKVVSLKKARTEFESRLEQQVQQKQDLLERLRVESERNTHSLTQQEQEAKLNEIKRMEASLEEEKQLVKQKYTDDVQSRIAEFEEKVRLFQQQQREQSLHISKQMEEKRLHLVEQEQAFERNKQEQRQKLENELQQRTQSLDREWSQFRERQHNQVEHAENQLNQKLQELEAERESALSQNGQLQKSLQEEHESKMQLLESMEIQFEEEHSSKLQSATVEEELQKLEKEKQAFQTKLQEQRCRLEEENASQLEEMRQQALEHEKSFEEKKIQQQKQFDQSWQQLEQEKEKKIREISEAEKMVEAEFEQKFEDLSTQEEQFDQQIASEQSKLEAEQKALEEEQENLQKTHEQEFHAVMDELQQNLEVEEPLEPALDEERMPRPVPLDKDEQTQLRNQEAPQTKADERLPDTNSPSDDPIPALKSIDTSFAESISDPAKRLKALSTSIHHRLNQLTKEGKSTQRDVSEDSEKSQADDEHSVEQTNFSAPSDFDSNRADIQELQRKLNTVSEMHKTDLIALLKSLDDSQRILENYQQEAERHHAVLEDSRRVEPDLNDTKIGQDELSETSLTEDKDYSIEEDFQAENTSKEATKDETTTESTTSKDLKDLSQQELIETIQQIQERVSVIQSKLDEQASKYQDKVRELETIKTLSSQQQIIEELMRVKDQERVLRDQLEAKNKLLQQSETNFAQAQSSVKENAMEKYNTTLEKLSQEREQFEKSYAEAEQRYKETIDEMNQKQEELRREYEEKLQMVQNSSQITDDDQQVTGDTDLNELRLKLEAEHKQVSELQQKIQQYETEKQQLTKDRELLIQEKEHYNQLKKDLDEKLSMVQQISLNLQNVEKSSTKAHPDSDRVDVTHREELEQMHSVQRENIEREKEALKAELEQDKAIFEQEQAQKSELAQKEIQHTTDSLNKLKAQFETEHEKMKKQLSEEYAQKNDELEAEKKRLEELENKLNERDGANLPPDAQIDNLLRRRLDKLSENLYKLKEELAQRETRINEEERKLETRIDNQNEMVTRYEHKMRDEQREIKQRMHELQLREEELELRYSKLTGRVNDVQVDVEHNFKPLRRLYTALDSQTITSTTMTTRSLAVNSEKRVVYISRMVSVADCESIVKQSLVANKESNITGVLISSDSAFIHIIEGKTRDVDRLYRHIIRDRRHHDIHCIRVEDDILSRLYNTPMRFIRTPAHLIGTGASADTLSTHSFTNSNSRLSPSGRVASPHFSSRFSETGDQPSDAQAVLHLFDVLTSTYRCIEKYVPPVVINMSKSSVNPLLLPPVQKERIIMLVDVVRFAIKLRVEEIKSIMAKYLSIARKCVTKYRGDVLQYTGNSIVAVFEGDQAHNAVKASMLLFKTVVAKMPIDVRTRNVPVLQLGVVLTQGEVLEGSFGCGAQMSYQVVGEHVQRAWQIASHLPELSFLFAFDKSVRASLKKQQSPYDNQAKHIGSIFVNTARNNQVELYSLTKKEVIFNQAPVRRSRRGDDILSTDRGGLAQS
eukprot:CAMPEP_0117455674 /NCGR_PEP_ID=MMETSP0759-20121206/11485_1 /TAXON_ID=63605 /ORGANISM="Percolomonas cosmopolitus, Strain WS" /LENGTH=2619 /DNA_ID=CAMNT_0005248993 /DNA_START=312 /DNA_END=8171 /DNA_ORIENTATION=-